MQLMSLAALLLLISLAPVHAQADFFNLNFEIANFYLSLSDQASMVPTTSAFPGWRAYLGGVEQTSVYYNVITFGSANVAILHTNTFLRLGPIQGNFSAVLQAGGS